jgi:hypothetical protein
MPNYCLMDEHIYNIKKRLKLRGVSAISNIKGEPGWKLDLRLKHMITF